MIVNTERARVSLIRPAFFILNEIRIRKIIENSLINNNQCNYNYQQNTGQKRNRKIHVRMYITLNSQVVRSLSFFVEKVSKRPIF